MPIQKCSARVSDSFTFNDKFQYLHFELIQPHRIEFRAGQYLLLEVPGTEQKKSYSIASSPSIDHAVELLVDLSPHGVGTTYIMNLKPGDPVSFYAPAGEFCVAPAESEVGSQEKALAFVATGSGITAIRSMILDQLQAKHDTRPMTLFWGLRFEQDAFWIEDFHDLEKLFPNFHLHLVFSQAESSWPFCRGRVTDCLAVHPMIEYAGYYLCGRGAMIKDAQSLLLSQGVAQEHIHHEKFY